MRDHDLGDLKCGRATFGRVFALGPAQKRSKACDSSLCLAFGEDILGRGGTACVHKAPLLKLDPMG